MSTIHDSLCDNVRTIEEGLCSIRSYRSDGIEVQCCSTSLSGLLRENVNLRGGGGV